MKQDKNTSKIESMEFGSAIRDYMMEMSLEAVINRALPFLEDGFKPSQRKILYTMHTMGLYNKNAKCANIEGANMKINAHGGSYSTLVRLTREKEVLLTPLIDGKGSFGKIYSSETQEAAQRYTEAKLSKICQELTNSLSKHPNNMVDNYDGTLKEPALLSAPFPQLLANPQDGIGIGFACSFPSFNLSELCDATISVLKGKNSFEHIFSKMPYPDFSTAGYILADKEEIKKMYTTGQGKVLLRGKLVVKEKENIIEVVEPPYTTTVEKIISEIRKAYDKGKLNEIIDVKDGCGLEGFKVLIYYKKGTDVNRLIEKLYSFTSIQDSYSSNMNLVYNRRPQMMGVIEIIEKWVEHRKQWVKEEVDYDINDKEHSLKLLYGLNKILLDIEKAVKIVKNSKTDEQVISSLMSKFKLDEEQAEFVANIKLRNFNKDYILNKTKEISKLEKEVDSLKSIDITKFMISELERIKKQYGIPRKTQIIEDWKPIETENIKEEFVDDNEYSVFTSNETVKRVLSTSTAKHEDMKKFTNLKSNDEILAFSTLGKIFKIKVDKLKMNNQINVSTLLRKNDLDAGETIIFTTILKPESDIIVVYDNNTALRFNQKSLVTQGNKHCFKKGYNVENIPIYIEAIDKDKEILVNGISINTKKIKSKGSRTAKSSKIK